MEWEAFLPHVLPDAKACPDGEAIDAVIKAAREFLGRTQAWSYQCDPILTEAGRAEYVIQLGEHQDLVRLNDVRVADLGYEVVAGFRGRAALRATRTSRLAYMNGPLGFLLTPIPTANDDPIVTDIVVKPSLGAPSFPDDLAEHVEAIALGAVAAVCLQGGEDWSNKDLAIVRRAQFEDRISSIKQEVSRGYGRTVQRRTRFL